MKEIHISELNDFRIGHAWSVEGGTGCTSIICEKGAVAGCDVRGGGPATRETPLLDPVKSAQQIHCVMLSGGSAFGLAAGDGAMEYLEENKIGYQLTVFTIPLVVGACIFDLAVGKPGIRPDKEMGYAASKAAYIDVVSNAESSNVSNAESSSSGGQIWLRTETHSKFGEMLACNGMEAAGSGEAPADRNIQGNIGAGTGATVGKINGPLHAMNSGLGVWAGESEGVKIAAIAVVNALGDVVDDNGIIAGCRDNEGGFADTARVLMGRVKEDDMFKRENTTLVWCLTNAAITKDQANKAAQVMHNAFGKRISPVHTSADGDASFLMASGQVKANADALSAMAEYAASKAIVNAVLKTEAAFGMPAAADIR